MSQQLPSSQESPSSSGSYLGNPVAALFVETGGCYFNLPGVDAWDIERDARTYSGPLPVVAHPPCQRWGRFWHGSPRKPHQFKLGDDGGCFAAAVACVQAFGGVLEHPEHSHAFRAFNLPRPAAGHIGWTEPDRMDGRTCRVEQGQCGHTARKATWLYAVLPAYPDLDWTRGEQQLDPVILARHGYEYARRKGMVSMIGGKDKVRIRNATPIPFRDLLLSMAASCHR